MTGAPCALYKFKQALNALMTVLIVKSPLVLHFPLSTLHLKKVPRPIFRAGEVIYCDYLISVPASRYQPLVISG